MNDATPPERYQEALPRRLGLWSTSAIVVGMIIGSGIFRTPSSIAETIGSVGGVGIIWVLGGLITICLALCLAELATMFPRAGGIYVYLREAWGPGVAFVYGWTFLLINPSQWAAISLIFAEYLGQYTGFTENEKRLAASLLIALVTGLNYFSVRLAAAIQTFATSAKALALAGLALVVFLFASGTDGALAQPPSFSVPSLGAFGVALVAVLWPYEGVAASCALAGEVHDPARNLPRALVMSVAAVMVLYLLVNAAYLYALPLERVARSGLVASEAMQTVVGSGGAAVIGACVMISTFGAVAAAAIVDPRVFYAMARDGLFFQKVGAIHARHQTPHVAVIISGALAIAYLWVRSFEELAAQFILGLWLFYGLAVLGLLRLRARSPDAPRPYRVLAYPLVPIAFVLSAGWLLLNSFVELPQVSLLNLAVTLAGIPVYWLWTKLRRPR